MTFFALTFVSVIVGLGVILVVLHRLRRIFRRLVEGRPFLDENARSLRFIGLAVVVGELALAAIQYFGQRAITRGLSSAELSFHASFAPRPAVILAGLILMIVAEVFREGTKMRADLETARSIQTSLVAAQESHHGLVSIHARMQPAAEVGGDYYDVIDLGDGRLAFVIADVAGKGLPAALLMTLLRGSIRALLAAGLRNGKTSAGFHGHRARHDRWHAVPGSLGRFSSGLAAGALHGRRDGGGEQGGRAVWHRTPRSGNRDRAVRVVSRARRNHRDGRRVSRDRAAVR